MDARAMCLLFTCMGCKNRAGNTIVDDQGINHLHELRYLIHADDETLCKNVKWLRGVAPGDGGGANLVHMISHLVEMNIKLAAYWLWYSEKFSRPRIGADVTFPSVRSICALRDAEGTYDDPSTPTIDDQNWPRAFDAIVSNSSQVDTGWMVLMNHHCPLSMLLLSWWHCLISHPKLPPLCLLPPCE